MNSYATSSRLRRTLPACVARLLCLVGIVGCSLLGPGDTVYVLTHVNGAPVPSAHVRGNLLGGGWFEVQAVRGELRVSGGRFRKNRDFQTVENGIPQDSIRRSHWSGRVERTDTTLIIRFVDERRDQAEFTYRLLDGGRRIRGVEWIVGMYPAVYEYESR
jgi:hypothetical protein